MRIVVLSAFPRLDRHPYKHAVLEGLAERHQVIADVAVVYAYTSVASFVRRARKQYTFPDAVARLRAVSRQAGLGQGGQRTGSPARAGSTRSRSVERVARDLGYVVRKFESYSGRDCIGFLSQCAPDLILNLGGMYVPTPVLDIPRFGVVGGHYARLPDIRGVDTIRWTILLDRPVEVSHQLLSPAYDLGDVVRTARVTVRCGADLGAIRTACQEEHARGCLAVIDATSSGHLVRERQAKRDGSYFKKMGKTLRRQVDYMLRQCRYSHYAESSGNSAA